MERASPEVHEPVTVALDAMGGDRAPGEIVAGAVLAVRQLGVRLLLVGDERVLHAELAKHGQAAHPAITVVHAAETVGMDEHASASARKRPTSMQLVADAVKDGRADAGVSAGNSGAFYAIGLFTLRRIPGIDRPALATVFPTSLGTCLLLDVGANAECKANQLVDFACMGSIYATRLLNRPFPKVGLLSNGEEATKGPPEVQEAHQLLLRTDLNFVGNVEGKDVPRGVVDVVVCDGYAGNVLLKTAEGVAESLVALLRQELTRTPFRKLLAAGLKPAFGVLRSRLDYAEYGGAVLLGLRAPLVIAHGRSNARAIMNAVRVGRDAAAHNVATAIEQGVTARTRTDGA